MENENLFHDENVSFSENVISLIAFDQKVSELMTTSETDPKLWKCKKCSYTNNNKSHTKDHVEIHITGLKIKCDSCDESFYGRRRNVTKDRNRFHQKLSKMFIHHIFM